MDKEELKAFISERVQTHWNAVNSMLFLASIPTELREKRGVDYKDILGEQKLKEFAVETSGQDTYKLIVHPTQKSKVGLVPYSVDFEFTDLASDNRFRDEKRSLPSESRNITLEFLELISALPARDQESIDIPTWIIAKLVSVR